MPYMIKHLRIGFCLLLVLLMIPFAAQAAGHDYHPVDQSRIGYQLPAGMRATVNASDGMLDILINTERTDWGLVLASSLSSWGTLNMPVAALPPDNAVGQKNVHIGRGEYSDSSKNSEDVYAKFDMAANDVFNRPGPPFLSTTYHNGWDFANYNEEQNAVVPDILPDNCFQAHLVAWQMADDSIVYEYFMISVRFTDESAFHVDLNVPNAARLAAHPGTDAEVSDGSVVYKIASDSPFKGQDIQTSVYAPANAGSYALSCYGETLPAQEVALLDNGRKGLKLDHHIVMVDSIEEIDYSILWYASADGSGTPIAAEYVNIQLIIGKPQPFPRYIDELEAIPASRMMPIIANNGAAANVSFITADYAENNENFDILYKRVKPASIPEDADLSTYSTKLYAAPPAGAVAYSVAFRTRDTIYGAMQRYYEDSFVPTLTSPQERRTAFETVNGKQAALLYQAPLFKPRAFSHDPSLTLYTSRDDTDPITGRVIMVYWYDSMDEDAEPIAKEYMIDKVEPFSLVRTTPAYGSEDDLPNSISMPVVVTGNNVGILNLMLVIEKPVFSGENCTLYGLHLADADGNKVVIGDTVAIILPYPDVDGDVSQMRFSINHYNESYQLLETYSEDNGLLVRTPIGLAFQTESFSPFVLSWNASEGLAAAQLPKTGDMAPALGLMMTALLGSVFVLLQMKKKSAR